jgi:hypothetical protein
MTTLTGHDLRERMAETVWRRQYDALHAQLAPYVVTYGDDWQGVGAEAPEGLRTTYAALQSLGYARGWMS